MKKYLGLALSVISSLFLFSCDIGLGEVVDIDAPEITLRSMTSEGKTNTNFGTTLYTKRNVVFQGSAWDNTGVENVHAEVKWLGDEDYKFLKNASVSGGEWKLDIDFGGREGACWLKIVSEDKKKNYGSKSARVISLFVDEKAPVGEAWYIDRLVNGIQYNLQTKEALEAIVEKDPTLSQPSNIDVAQNVKFKICSSFNDASGIKSVKISIWEGNTRIGEVGQDSGTSSYAPQFTIDKMALSGLPDSGLHYLQVKYTAEDVVTDPGANIVENKEFDMGYFIWWPKSDDPRYYISQADERGDLKLHINDSVNVTVFDDDGFNKDETIKCVLKETSGSIVDTFSYTVKSQGERECNIIVKAPSESQTLKLQVTAKDMKDKSLNEECNVLVTDDNHPTLIITSPENNQIPSVEGVDSDISFSGITLDASGCTNLMFVWVPDAVADKAVKAQAWLKSYTLKKPASDEADVENGADGMKLYNVKLTAASDANGLKQQSFSFKTSLMNAYGDDKTKDKYFYIRLVRKDGNYTESELKLAADNIKPEMKLLYPAGNMAMVDKDKSIKLRFMAEKSSKLAIDTSKYKIEYIAPNGTATPVSGTYNGTGHYYESNEISAADLSSFYDNNISPKYKFYAEDILGNKNEATYQFIISALPQISSVSSSAPAKCKAGDDILINVSFTKPVTCTSDAKLKITNISNALKSQAPTKELYADYESGSGSTTLVFKYTVQDGDKSNQLQVINTSDYGPIKDKDTVSGHLTYLTAANNLQAKKTIAIDGVRPVATGIALSTDAATENTYNGTTYLKEGRTLTATVTVDKKVTVQGAPKFKVLVGSDPVELTWQSITYRDSNQSEIVFSRKISSSDKNGAVTYSMADCLEGISDIKDDFGNALINGKTGSGTEKITIDTAKPGKPVLMNKADDTTLKSGKYKGKVQFAVSNVNQDHTKTEYSTDGGTNWNDYNSTKAWTDLTGWAAPANVELTASGTVTTANLVVRITDRAGNVSDYSDPVSLEINNTFPDYTVECTNGDGNYRSGTLTFKVSFADPVDVSYGDSAYIDLSGCQGEFGSASDKKAVVDPNTKGKKGLSEITFKYEIVNGDSFTVKVNKDAVHLLSIKDQYGVEQNGKTISGNADYVRPKLRCDNVPPKVVKMTPGGTRTQLTGKNIYTAGKTIVLEFNEPVKVVSGKIYLRQTAGWAIPPVFTVSDFNKVLNAVKAAGNDTKIDSLTGSQILYMDGAEDSEWLFANNVGRANDVYHGTGQYVGPYKKSTMGIDGSGNPDVTTKYVLDYDMDIWNGSARYGKTFASGNNSQNNNESRTSEDLSFNTNLTSISAANIRTVLEKIHFHERYMNVNSASVSIDPTEKYKVTITVPKGFLGDDDLQPGREWELVIEKGCFMDESGNYFGYEADGTMTEADSRQATNSSTDVSAEWSRERSTVASTDPIRPLVLVQDGANPSFLSSGVAKPVIRVDRYSYNIGNYQPTGNGMNIARVTRDTRAKKNDDNTYTENNKPTARVRVRIDCETPGAVVRYTTSSGSNSITIATGNNGTNGDEIGRLSASSGTIDKFHDVDLVDGRDKDCWSYWTATSVTMPADPTASSTGGHASEQFLAGNGNYKQSSRQYIKAKAFANNLSSEVEKEGVFQTVLHIVSPYNARNMATKCASQAAGWQDLSIRGTTGWAGEPSISPFPLRDSQVGSPFLKRAYMYGDDYYWVSYELLVGTGFSNYCSNGSSYDWSRSWGWAMPGEFTRCINMRRW